MTLKKLILLFSFLLFVSCLSSNSSSPVDCVSECSDSGGDTDTSGSPNEPSDPDPQDPDPQDPDPQDPDPQDPGPQNPGSSWGQALDFSRVFVSGHSLMDNPLVDYLEDVAVKKGDDHDYNQQIVIGSPIRVRTAGSNPDYTNFPGYSEGKNRNGSTGLNVISELRDPQTIGANELYDALVVTENHEIIDMLKYEQTVTLMRHYHDLFMNANPSGRTFLYTSWLNIDKTNPAPWVAHEKNSQTVWECVTTKINLSLEDDSRTDRIKPLPAGGALTALVEASLADSISGINGTTQDKMNQIFDDNVHLTNLGKYFISLVVYSAVYRKSPSGVAPPSGSGVSSSMAEDMQTLAWTYINDYYNETNGPIEHSMASCRELMVNSYCESYFGEFSANGDSNRVQTCLTINSNASDNGNYFVWPDSNFNTYPAPPAQ